MFKKMAMGMGVLVSVLGTRAAVFGEAAATQGAATTQAGAMYPPVEGHPYGHMPKSKKEILGMAAEQARVEMMTALANGNQRQVEELLPELVKLHPEDQGLKFFQAVVTRSRFEVEEAMPQFEAVVAMDGKTPEGQCAGLMLKIDRRESPGASLGRMAEVAKAHGEDLLIQWTVAIGCRTLNQNVAGCKVYEYILKAFYPGEGPVLMHQTYANMLDGAGLYEKAAMHRNIAVMMEPAGWSYQGLANTLTMLKQYDEANRAYRKAVELSPNEGLYWQTWGDCLRQEGFYDEAEKKFEKAVALDPRDTTALHQWGLALEGEKNLDQAVAKYRQMIKVAPGEYSGYFEAHRVLLCGLGRNQEAMAVIAEWKGRENR